MSAEQIDLENLKGKSILEVISVLPALSWRAVDFGNVKALNPQITRLRFVIYDTKLPRVSKRERDYPFFIQVPPGMLVEMGQLTEDVLAKTVPGRTIGITSTVGVDVNSIGSYMCGRMQLFPDLDYYTVAPLQNDLYGRVHIPFIDIEADGICLPQEELVNKVKEEIRQKTQTSRGVLLKSGRINHFHFIGTDRLLGPEAFVDFIGQCLDMDIDGKPIVDTFWAGHCLTASLGYPGRCATLRITTNKIKQNLPTVVDVLES